MVKTIPFLIHPFLFLFQSHFFSPFFLPFFFLVLFLISNPHKNLYLFFNIFNCSPRILFLNLLSNTSFQYCLCFLFDFFLIDHLKVHIFNVFCFLSSLFSIFSVVYSYVIWRNETIDCVCTWKSICSPTFSLCPPLCPLFHGCLPTAPRARTSPPSMVRSAPSEQMPVPASPPLYRYSTGISSQTPCDHTTHWKWVLYISSPVSLPKKAFLSTVRGEHLLPAERVDWRPIGKYHIV